MVTLKNDALLHQAQRQGIYQRAGKVNGKTSWIFSKNNSALWYNTVAQDWMIGSLDNLGTSTGGIGSEGDQGRTSCPYNVPQYQWVYFGNAWTFTSGDDVSIECLEGNHNIGLSQAISNQVQNMNKT